MSRVIELSEDKTFREKVESWGGSKKNFYHYWTSMVGSEDGETTVREAYNLVKNGAKETTALAKNGTNGAQGVEDTPRALEGELLVVDANEFQNETEAREAVKKINRSATNLAELLLDFYMRDGRKALGYKTWQECVVNEFSESLGVNSDRNFFYLINSGIVRSNLLQAAQEEDANFTAKDVDAFSNHALRAMDNLPYEGQVEVATLSLARAEVVNKKPKITEKLVRQVAKEYLAPSLSEKAASEKVEMKGGGTNALRGNFLDGQAAQEGRAEVSGIVALTLCEEDNAVVFNAESDCWEFIAQDENGQTYTLPVPIVKLQEAGAWRTVNS